MGRSDYAANEGSNYWDVNEPNSTGQSPNQSYNAKFDWSQLYGTINSGPPNATGAAAGQA